MQSHTPATPATPTTPESTAVIETLLQLREMKESKISTREIRKQLLGAIIATHRKNIDPEAFVSGSSSQEMRIDEYLKDLVGATKPRILTLLHMTMIMDACFAKNRHPVLSKQDYCKLVMACLFMALKFHEWPLDDEENLKQLAAMEEDFAKAARSPSVSALKRHEEAVFKEVGSNIRYSDEAYRAAQARLLPGHEEILGEKIEYQHESCADVGAPLAASLTDGEIQQIRDQLIETLRVRLVDALREAPKIPRLEKFPYYEKTPTCSIEYYLHQFAEKLNAQVPTFIFMVIYLYTWLEKTGDTFNTANYHALLAASFLAAEVWCKDYRDHLDKVLNRETEKVSGFSHASITEMKRVFFPVVEVYESYCHLFYERVQAHLLPDYTLNLTPRTPSHHQTRHP